MAKVIGAGHSDFMKGTLSGTTFRGYRGSNIVSASRRMTRAKPGEKLLTSPLALKKLWARWSADRLVITQLSGGVQYVTSWGDQKGGAGTVSQTVLANMPPWFASDPDRNGRPYILADGVGDYLQGVILGVMLPQPFEIWMVGDEPVASPIEARMIAVSTVLAAGLSHAPIPSLNYWLKMTLLPVCGVNGDGKVKVWRMMFNVAASWMEWNGVKQTALVNVGAGEVNRITFFSRTTLGQNSSFKCFEIDIFSSILSEVERGQLLRWFYDTYRLPA